MKKITSVFVLLLLSAFVRAQGLQDIIVETYYISDAADAAGSIGTLPEGSVTYRIYVDMASGYKFQAAYGSPTHTLSIGTTTSFFNNEDRGATTPTYTKTQAKNNTVMLDSWLSVGAACAGNFGILKADDNGTSTVVNADGLLKNNNAQAGIPLTLQDGLLAGTPQAVTTVGIASELAVFDATSQAGNLFTTTNGSWASLNGSAGPTPDNRVLIAQITTDGVLSFELNIQIGDSVGGVEKYVAKNPVGNETVFSGLTYASNTVKVNEVNTAAAPEFNVYPNPTADAFTMAIDIKKQGNENKYTIYDFMGNMVYSKQLNGILGKHNERVDLSGFASGNYLVQLSVDGNSATKKITKN